MAAERHHMERFRAVETLLVCSELEMRIARFYERLAEMFDDDQQVSEFWLHMAEEEIDHADALRSAAETLPLMLPQDWTQEPLIERSIIRKLAHEINTCERLMTRHENSLEAAFRCALYIESSELNSIYQWLLDKVPVMWTGTLRMMKEDPGAHLLQLCQAIQQYCQEPALRQRARALRNQYEDYMMG